MRVHREVDFIRVGSGVFTEAVEVDAIGGKVYIARPQLPES